MSFVTWHNYGYGICTDDIQTHNVECLQELLKLAPVFQADIHNWLSAREIDDPTWDDYMDCDEDYVLGLATILKEVMEEVEGISLTACDDYEGTKYLIYQAKFPWEITDTERDLTKEKLTELFDRYVSILTDEIIAVDDQAVENGG